LATTNLRATARVKNAAKPPNRVITGKMFIRNLLQSFQDQLDDQMSEAVLWTKGSWGSRDFPSKNDKVLWKPRHLWPLEGYYFFHIPILALIG
jgi:hypothetical protein